jgi:hypothetical protein
LMQAECIQLCDISSAEACHAAISGSTCSCKQLFGKQPAFGPCRK